MSTETARGLRFDLLERIADRAFAQMVAMIHIANSRKDKDPSDPKVGGHPAACASSFHVLGALHLVVREPQDFVCCKPHASPIDHAYHHLMRLMRREDGTWLTDDESEGLMERLRKFAQPGASDVFQSYHAKTDPDSFHFLPSGTVGIPPVNSIFLALAYRYAADHGFDVPKDAHFWSLMGDSEFREGSLFEAMPEASERKLGNVTWMIDYNRQSLDGTRGTWEDDATVNDAVRIERTALANGWKVVQVRHGRRRLEVFEQPGGKALQKLLEGGLPDYELQLLLFRRDADLVRATLTAADPACAQVLEQLSDNRLLAVLGDLGGHDLHCVTEAMQLSRTEPDVPYLLIFHTIKGFGLECYADPANHSSLPSKKEVSEVLERNGLSTERPFAHFPDDSEEARFLAERAKHFKRGMEQHAELIQRNREDVRRRVEDAGGVPDSLGIDLSMFPLAHTQQMWGQIAAKLVRIATHGLGGAPIGGAAKAEADLDEFERQWAPAANMVMTMSPDVGTSTQIAPTMNSRIYGPDIVGKGQRDRESAKFEARHPELVQHSNAFTRHVRFEICEQNSMSAAGSFGAMNMYTGIPLMPIMTVYDFFLKRALDQLYYNVYWRSEFVLMSTPSGVTLSPEGAQHSWKSDIQMPNLITWEPAFAVELDWILSDAIARQVEGRNVGRSGVLIRGVTRSLKQKDLLAHLGRHAANKQGLGAGTLLAPAGSNWSDATDESTLPAVDDATLLEGLRTKVLAGAYHLIDWRGYAGYEPGDNVVQLFCMGSLVTEAVAASERLLERGIYANVIVVSSPELLCGILGHEEDYRYLTEGLGISGDLYAVPQVAQDAADLVTIAGRRVPIVSVHDGEAGLLDNLGSIVGVKQLTLAVRRFSKCGRPNEVYGYQGIDADAVFDACGRALAETALESVQVSRGVLGALEGRSTERPHWRELWPSAE
ncbi:Pyruvate dehydrogenase E1 component [Planctomycetes bacterium Pla163]|uniref:Pyruvate dehydrogenase E1 component n=1 Tax=Rohdeia mirabilis TaxID=2528008 RepID=A0A518D1P9_9BACT|nr:Pyruvate dehydrogenase E1 component [Planctomycetes bacterium Pla163]